MLGPCSAVQGRQGINFTLCRLPPARIFSIPKSLPTAQIINLFLSIISDSTVVFCYEVSFSNWYNKNKNEYIRRVSEWQTSVLCFVVLWHMQDPFDQYAVFCIKKIYCCHSISLPLVISKGDGKSSICHLPFAVSCSMILWIHKSCDIHISAADNSDLGELHFNSANDCVPDAWLYSARDAARL